ncbi:MAG: ABC transporter ATP-binding protein [Micavibrio sp.]|nr:MAG: ABC transporter ATP-binding protein [Micavibrio sp.]
MPALLQAENITRILPLEIPVTLVKDASMTVETGEFISITGPSGSGKSSLLYLLGILDRPTEGRVLINGEDTSVMEDDQLAALRLKKIGFIFQSHFLLPEFSALENVMLPMRRLGLLNEKEIENRAQKILEDLGLGEHSRKLPRQMSGGQSQRVAIARALANDPPLILADEPTGNLDSVSSKTVEDMLKDLTQSYGRTVIYVTHDMEFAERAGRRIHIIDGRLAPPPNKDKTIVKKSLSSEEL